MGSCDILREPMTPYDLGHLRFGSLDRLVKKCAADQPRRARKLRRTTGFLMDF